MNCRGPVRGLRNDIILRKKINNFIAFFGRAFIISAPLESRNEFPGLVE